MLLTLADRESFYCKLMTRSLPRTKAKSMMPQRCKSRGKRSRQNLCPSRLGWRCQVFCWLPAKLHRRRRYADLLWGRSVLSITSNALRCLTGSGWLLGRRCAMYANGCRLVSTLRGHDSCILSQRRRIVLCVRTSGIRGDSRGCDGWSNTLLRRCARETLSVSRYPGCEAMQGGHVLITLLSIK